MEWLVPLQGQIVGLDTAPLIYFIEENPNYLDVTDAFFEAMFRGEFSVVTSRGGASFFLTNDARLPSLPALTVLVLDTLIV
ncbi:hypothetical protein LC605_03090 [Nostoc sp. CHAB 5836]|uniref:hypothetical protein n=1 Tax=Nostoc sp. CHAB 5836 TaxID=2780404 RepID=UPI001E28E739|nr:hypothetical protein [Nostoc sp. CHAB 5836]MCC5614077.1 hypothetical protein [Nostoc sp. CHAB 5836]